MSGGGISVAAPTAPTMPDAAEARPIPTTAQKGGVIRALGLGIITGAADDDPSAIGTYAAAGATLGPGFLWTAPGHPADDVCGRLPVGQTGAGQRQRAFCRHPGSLLETVVGDHARRRTNRQR